MSMIAASTTASSASDFDAHPDGKYRVVGQGVGCFDGLHDFGGPKSTTIGRLSLWSVEATDNQPLSKPYWLNRHKISVLSNDADPGRDSDVCTYVDTVPEQDGSQLPGYWTREQRLIDHPAKVPVEEISVGPHKTPYRLAFDGYNVHMGDQPRFLPWFSVAPFDPQTAKEDLEAAWRYPHVKHLDQEDSKGIAPACLPHFACRTIHGLTPCMKEMPVGTPDKEALKRLIEAVEAHDFSDGIAETLPGGRDASDTGCSSKL